MKDWHKEIGSMSGWTFGNTSEMADQIAAQTASGMNSATCSLFESFSAKKRPLPKIGDRAYIKDSKGNPVCVVEITKVEILLFSSVGQDFAAAEGYRSLAQWRAIHSAFFAGAADNFTAESKVVCQWFKVPHLF